MSFSLSLLVLMYEMYLARAMRNRGLEMYLVDGWTRPQDIRAVLLQAGLTQPLIQNFMITAHTDVASCLPGLCQLLLNGSHVKKCSSFLDHCYEIFENIIMFSFLVVAGKLFR